MTAEPASQLPFERPFAGRRVIVTGHTGFKGGWLALWLSELGADVYGIALAPNTKPNLFEALKLSTIVHHDELDVRRRDAFIERVAAIAPDVVFHLAAQPLVRRSYDEPLDTIETNVMGTAHMLEAARHTPSLRAIVCVTTDKVYENREWIWPYRETDSLGGKDPYSASKAAAELIAAAYRHSFLARENRAAVATARGGNVIGGGDWSEDRIVPDLMRAIESGSDLTIRNPLASRPWQHVLNLCHGYLQIADGLLSEPGKHVGAWNFGPDVTITVRELLHRFGAAWKLPRIVEQPTQHKHEDLTLALDATKAHKYLGWRSSWSLDETVRRTAEWYRSYFTNPGDALAMTREQIAAYRDSIAHSARSSSASNAG